MPKEIRHRYAINFDLTIEKLREFYSDTNPKGAYSKIKNFMKSTDLLIDSGLAIYLTKQ